MPIRMVSEPHIQKTLFIKQRLTHLDHHLHGGGFLCPRGGARMICPYRNARQVQRYIKQDIHDEEGAVIGCEDMQWVDFVPAQCNGKDCGVWQNGACHYAAVSVET